jgi:hypothetical protein
MNTVLTTPSHQVRLKVYIMFVQVVPIALKIILCKINETRPPTSTSFWILLLPPPLCYFPYYSVTGIYPIFVYRRGFFPQYYVAVMVFHLCISRQGESDEEE